MSCYMSNAPLEVDSKVLRKLSAARTRLIMERPFLGSLVLRLGLEEADHWCKSTATDAKSIYYNAEHIEALNAAQVQFSLAHNALHCALSHFNRRGNRDQHRWDAACDFAINAMLVSENMFMPPEALYLEEYEGMSAEEIYPLVKENPDQDPQDQHLFDSDGEDGEEQSQSNIENKLKDKTVPNEKPTAKPKALSPQEKENLSVQWQQRLAGAAQQAAQAGKISESMLRLVDHLLQPQISWRALLAGFMSDSARDDYSYDRPSTRREGSAIYPSMRSKQINIAAVVDTSGSMSQNEISEFLNEINAIKSQVKARITIIACDEELVCEPSIFEPWETMRNLEGYAKGQRGTSFVPPFVWLMIHSRPQDLVVYFTDAQGIFPQEPSIPVLWLVKGKAQVPWGRRIQLN